MPWCAAATAATRSIAPALALGNPSARVLFWENCMKIIRRGKPWELTTECRKCRTLLVLEESDIELVPRGSADADFGKTAWHCPECKSEWDITVPEHVVKMATANAKWNVGQGR